MGLDFLENNLEKIETMYKWLESNTRCLKKSMEFDIMEKDANDGIAYDSQCYKKRLMNTTYEPLTNTNWLGSIK